MSNIFDYWKLLAGLGLFLFAMVQLEMALKKLAGNRFRRFIRYSTDKPVSSALGGVLITAIVQSSSLVGLLVLAFVGAGIIPLVNAIGIILGSNLGTTVTGWLVATLGFKLDLVNFIYPLVALGGLSYGALRGKPKYISQLLLSLALLLMGLDFMKDSTAVLTEHVDISRIGDYPLILYLLMGVIFTAIIQSSSATMMLTLTALYSGIIPLHAAAAIVIGADLGTTSTVLLGSLQGEVSKRRIAMAHVIFNFSVDTVAFIALLPLLALIEFIHITDPLYALVAFHSLFNLIGIAVFLPFTKQYATFLERLIKEDDRKIHRYIHTVPEKVTDAAIEALAKETRYLIYLVIQLNKRYMRLALHTQVAERNIFSMPKLLNDSTKLEHYIAIKRLEGEIVRYAIKIQVEDPDEANNNDSAEKNSLKINNLISAARSAVYSAKALKNIDEDIESFYVMDNETIGKYFKNLQDTTESINNTLFSFLEKTGEKNIFKEELDGLKEKSKSFHEDIANEVYQKISGIHITSLNLSTLLNVNKEIQTSEKALINAIALI